MTTPILINIVVAIAYYIICIIAFMYIFLSECLSFIKNNPIIYIIVINIYFLFYILKIKREHIIIFNTCKGLSGEIVELIKINDGLKSNQDKLMIEYSKKDVKIDHLYKKCKQCSILKNVLQFNKNMNSKDTYTNYCKDCNVNY